MQKNVLLVSQFLIGKVQIYGLSLTTVGKNTTKQCHSKDTLFIMFLLQYLKKNISIYGQPKNTVLSLLFRLQLLNKTPRTVTVNIKIRGKIQISLKESDELQNLELVS